MCASKLLPGVKATWMAPMMETQHGHEAVHYHLEDCRYWNRSPSTMRLEYIVLGGENPRRFKSPSCSHIIRHTHPKNHDHSSTI